MSIQVDSRKLSVMFPQPLAKGGDIVEWTRRLLYALSLDRRNRDILQDFNVENLAFSGTMDYKQVGNVVKISATSNATINASVFFTGPVFFIIANDATPRTITFGSNFLPAGTLVGTASKTAVVGFISDGTTLYEVSRTTGL